MKDIAYIANNVKKCSFKIGLILSAFLIFQIGNGFAQTKTPDEPKKVDINNLFILGSETNVAEVQEMKDFMGTLRGTPPATNEAACKYVLGMRKFQRGNDEVFDTLAAAQRLGLTVTGQTNSPEEEITRWVVGRAGDRIAMNKVIGIYECLPADEVKEEIRNRIIDSLRHLGNLTAYVDEAKKIKGLSDASSTQELCTAFSAMKRESNKVETDLEEFALLYTANDASNPAASSVEFADPRITERAEKILNIRAKLFLPLKADIKANLNKHGCN